MGTELFYPYGPETTRVVTSSPLKKKLLHSVGVETDANPLKIGRVGLGETNHSIENGHGVIVRSRMTEVPYPVRVAERKAHELWRNLQPNGARHAVLDATWQVLDDSEEMVHSFNKPDTRKKRDEILTAIADLRGSRISSDAGIGVIERDLSGLNLFHTSLLLGVINPQVDMGMVEQIVTANPNVSGGFKAIDALAAGIIIADPFMHFRIRRINKDAEPYVQGRIMRSSTMIHELTYDSSNTPWIMKMALGIMPR